MHCFVQVKNLGQHMLIRHKKEGRLACDEPGCTTTFLTRHHKRKHMESVHEGVRSRCELCGKEVGNLPRHIKIVHDRVRAFPCPECEKTFQSSAYKRNGSHSCSYPRP